MSRRDGFVALLESNGYSVKRLLGIGAFGYVLECMRSDTNELVAVKVIPRYQTEFGQEEVKTLKQLKQFDPDTTNLVRFNQHFGLCGHAFLEFEKLDMSVLDLFKNSNKSFKLSEIQMITQQTLVALNTLRSIGMIHTDIKLDNIMLVNHKQHPFKVKLIDFGLACEVKGLCVGEILYVPEHRAPEVYLGLPLNEAVDMWALGCVMVSMYINKNLFSGKCKLGTMEEIVQLLGQPDDHLLNAGIYTHKYFYRSKDTWKLKSECSCSTGDNSVSYFSSSDTIHVHEPLSNMSQRPFTSLTDIVMTRPGVAEYEDTQAFVSFLTQILQVDPQKRITPSEALRHCFITTEYFPSDFINNSPDQEKAAACAEKPPRTFGSDAPAANRTAAGGHNTPERLSLVASLDNTLEKTSLISDNLAFYGGSTNDKATGSEFKVKDWIVKMIHRFVSSLFKKAPFANRLADSSVHGGTSAFSSKKPSTTAFLDEANTTIKNNGPVAVGINKICTDKKPLPKDILHKADTIHRNDGLTAAANRTTASNYGATSDEKPSPTTAAGAAGSETEISDEGISICPNNGPTGATDRTAAFKPLPTLIYCELTAVVDTTAVANDKRPSDEQASPTVPILNGAIIICPTDTTTAGSDTSPIDEKPACEEVKRRTFSRTTAKTKFLKKIHRRLSKVFKKGPFTNCFDVSNNNETAVTGNEKPSSPTAVAHETCDDRPRRKAQSLPSAIHVSGGNNKSKKCFLRWLHVLVTRHFKKADRRL